MTRCSGLSRGFLVAVLLSLLLLALPVRADLPLSFEWSSIGPTPLCCSASGEDTGRATTVAVNPLNADDIWIGTAGGGVWHSPDAVHWYPMSDDQASLAIGSIALADCTAGDGCGRVYAGTGENAIRRDTYYGAGLLVGVADTAGLHWTLRDGKPLYDFTHGSIYNVVLDRTTSGSGQVLYITLSSGVTASATESTVTAPEPYPGGYGIYRSSDDGATWTKLKIAGSDTGAGGGRPTDLEMDRTDPSVLYAGFLSRGIFKSTDGGLNWCPLNPGIPKPGGCPRTYGLPQPFLAQFDHVEIDIYRGDHNHLYATFGNCPDRLLEDCEPSVYESTDGGVNWTVRHWGSSDPTDSMNCPSQYSRYMHGLTIAPDDPSVLYLAGYRLCRSTNHGVSWSETGKTQHGDHHAVVFHDTDTTRAYDVNDGGVALSADGGDNWTRSNLGLTTLEFQSLATSPATFHVIGGTQDNGGVLWWGSKQWRSLTCCGDGGFAVMETSSKDKMYMTTLLSNPWVGGWTVLPKRSLDGGVSFPSPYFSPFYDSGIQGTSPRSFYPPMMEDPAGTVWFGTHSLSASTDGLTSFTARSPVLSTDLEEEILWGADVVTAIAQAPSDPGRTYLGYYSGKVFVSDLPCSAPTCWTQRSSGLPAEPITWLAVDPASHDTAYATVSGFGKGIHVYRTTDAGLSWNRTGSVAGLSGVPANTIVFAPGGGNVLYLGTDHGIFKSDAGGGSWYRFSDGLPNVPVFALATDPTRNRIFAATHGRGVFLLSSYYAKVAGTVGGPRFQSWDLALFGGAFGANRPCAVSVVRQDGSVCASASTDALGGVVHTDEDGFLVSSRQGYFADLPLVWVCGRGNCLGRESGACQSVQNPASSIHVTCGDQTATSPVAGVEVRPGPPGSPLRLTPPRNVPTTGGAFSLSPSLVSGDGSSRVLCSVSVPFTSADTEATLLQRAGDAVNSDPACAAAGLGAEVAPPQPRGAGEDAFPRPGELRLLAPQTLGEALFPAVRFLPGQATGLGFDLAGVDDPVRQRLRGMIVSFTTGAAGAAGGSVTITERSGMGQCSLTVPTVAGATATAIAASIAAAFEAPGIPGPSSCPSDVNPRDVTTRGEAIRTALAFDLEVRVDDAGIGATVAPEEVCLADAACDDGNPCTRDVCDVASGQCRLTSLPDGTACDDANLCTVGNACVNGACGYPLDCSDQNPCTEDRCEPSTGLCVNRAVVCDDANPCTVDACTAATGACVFTPTPGSACSDGDLCTTGDACVDAGANSAPTCQGQPKCADGDPCTADLCDEATGDCRNPPIACDDGDPCTTDVCQGGECLAYPLPGAACDDGDRCTIGDTCLGAQAGPPTCVGQAVGCDDGDPCTVDACDPVAGGCTHAPVAKAEVSGLLFSSHATMSWPPVQGAVYYDTYRGTLPAHGFQYDPTCFERDDSHGDGPRVATDPATPPEGTGFYYLVSQVSACGEGPIGSDSDGTLTPNLTACP